MITFSKTQLNTLTTEERELLENLVSRGKATVEPENGGFDVRAYLARRTANEAEEAECAQELEASFV